MADPDFGFYLEIIATLERLDIPYVIIGAFAGTSYGIIRATYDVDIVVDLQDSKIDLLAESYPGPRYYADPYQMRESIAHGMMFNIIDSTMGDKVDLIPITMQPSYQFALQNRIRREFPLSSETLSSAWFARPEDVIVGKLMAWDEGRSFKHESDIQVILIAIKRYDDEEIAASFDLAYIDQWSRRLSEDVAALWEQLKAVVGILPPNSTE
jgi:hypothetical protein